MRETFGQLLELCHAAAMRDGVAVRCLSVSAAGGADRRMDWGRRRCCRRRCWTGSARVMLIVEVDVDVDGKDGDGLPKELKTEKNTRAVEGEWSPLYRSGLEALFLRPVALSSSVCQPAPLGLIFCPADGTDRPIFAAIVTCVVFV